MLLEDTMNNNRIGISECLYTRFSAALLQIVLARLTESLLLPSVPSRSCHHDAHSCPKHSRKSVTGCRDDTAPVTVLTAIYWSRQMSLTDLMWKT